MGHLSQFGANTPKAPIEITKYAAKLWSDIVNSLPADYFRAGDLPLLAVKLRLCPSTRTRPDSASLQTANTGLRPWEIKEDNLATQ